MISISDYQGTNIEKAFGIDENTHLTPELIKQSLDQKLEKGLIDQPLYDKAVEQLNGLIEKAGKGEGSRGGHIIGHTKSGKAVYASTTKDPRGPNGTKSFTAQDHLDAKELHERRANEHRSKMFHTAGLSDHVKQQTSALIQHHFERAEEHGKEAHKHIQNEHESGLSADEKKIIAEQKKKQIEHHMKAREMHNQIAIHIAKTYGNMDADKPWAREAYEHHSNLAAHHHREVDKLDN